MFTNSIKCEESPKCKDLDKHVAEECSLTVLECHYEFVGCEVKLPRKDMPSHLEENAAHHLSLYEAKMSSVAVLFEKILTERKKYKKHCRDPPIDFTMKNYTLHRLLQVEWYSPYFIHIPVATKCALE